MYSIQPDKKSIIKHQSRSFIRSLFPAILYTFDTDYDPNYSKNGLTFNYEDKLEKIKKNIHFENYTKEQLIFLFQELDKSYLSFRSKHWTSFNRLFDRINRHNITIAPEKLQKLFTKSNLKNVRTIIKERHKNICSNYVSFKNSILDNEVNIKKKTDQLSINQIVLLLQEIGFFIHPKIKNTPKVKQANLISQITGLNKKNIKTSIQKLDKSVSENGSNYQQDIDKINKILDDLI